MPWSTYATVARIAGSVEDAEAVAVRGGASELGPPTFSEWWDDRIAETAVSVLAMLRGAGYVPPTDPAELSASDAILLDLAIGEQAWFENRPFELRQGGDTENPLPEIGIRLRQILGDLTRLDMATGPRSAFVPIPPGPRAAQAEVPDPFYPYSCAELLRDSLEWPP